MNFIDMHIHLQDYKANCATDIINLAGKNGICRLVCAATGENDWAAVADWAKNYPRSVVPAFGIHPWYVGEAAAGCFERLKALLTVWPQALIGETGLDGLADAVAVQQTFFAAHLALARELARPLIVHSVKAVALMRDFWSQMPDWFMIHSFNGHPEHLKPILRHNGYVSFSASILRNKHGVEIVRSVPVERLLLETDGPYQALEKGTEQTPLFLPKLLKQVAIWRQEDEESLSARILANSEEFINGK